MCVCRAHYSVDQAKRNVCATVVNCTIMSCDKASAHKSVSSTPSQQQHVSNTTNVVVCVTHTRAKKVVVVVGGP